MNVDAGLSPSDRRLLILLVILALAAFLRLAWLGDVDIRGDEVTYFLDLQDGVVVGDYLAKHFENFGADRQMPVPRVLGAAVVQLFGLDVTAWSIRLPFALAGLATIPVFWLLGWQLCRLRTQCWQDFPEAEGLAMILALMAAINPFHIYWSRTAHIYVFPMFFLSLALACAAGWVHALLVGREMQREGRLWLAGVVLGTVLASYSHMSAWIASALLWYILLGCWLRRHNPPWGFPVKPWPRALIVAGGFFALSLLPWAWKFVRAFAANEYDPVWDEVTNPLNHFSAMWRIPFIMTWGGDWRSLVTLALPLAAFVLGWHDHRWKVLLRLLAPALFVLFAALSLAQASGFFAFRYYVPMWPLLLLLSGLGLLVLAERFVLPRKPLLLGLVLVMSPALYDLLQLRGNPVELRRLVKTLDENFAADTPALVNGMNVVLFELRPYPSEKVIPTFTVQDIGFGMWSENNWRGSAEEFLRKFPDAVLVQQGRNFYEPNAAGPWDFPESFFAHEIVLRNEPALRLRSRMLGGSTDFYTGSVENSRAVTRIFYNRVDDVLARAQEEGQESLVLFGEGWNYFKPEDLSDWRVLRKKASLVVHNLNENPTDIQVVLSGIAPMGRKKVRVMVEQDDQKSAPAKIVTEEVLSSFEEPFTWRFTVNAEPGPNVIELVDEQYDFGLTPLFVSSLFVADNGTNDEDSETEQDNELP